MVLFVGNHELAQKVPSFLHGHVYEEGGWKAYIEDTMTKFRLFFTVIYVAFLIFYLMSALLLDFLDGGRRNRLFYAIVRVVVINITLVFFAHQVADKVKDTQFCKSVDSKTIYARPFLPKPILRPNRKNIGAKEEIISPTTVPRENDVLLGMRYDSKYIGNYINFLDYHPGNKELKIQLDNHTDLYHSYKGLPTSFQDEVVTSIGESFNRLLLQNEFGEWAVMTNIEKRNHVLKHLTFGASGMSIFPALDREIAILLSNAWFDTTIRTSKAMKQDTLKSLNHWRNEIVGKDLNFNDSKRKVAVSSTSKVNGGRFDLSSFFKLPSNHSQIYFNSKESTREKFIGSLKKEYKYKIEDRILYNYHGSGLWIDGYIIHLEYGNYGIVKTSFDDGLIERSGINLDKVKPYVPVVAGEQIATIRRKCPSCPNEFIFGSILTVHPNFEYDFEYEDGFVEFRIEDEYARVLKA